MVSGWWLGIAAGKAFFYIERNSIFTLMKNLLSHTHFSIVVLLLGMLCLEGCSLYRNFIWYSPYLIDENDKVGAVNNDGDSTQKVDYAINAYYFKKTASIWLFFILPFDPFAEDYEITSFYKRKGDLVIWVEKKAECPVVYINDNPSYGKVLETEEFFAGMEDHDMCHYGKLPIEQQQIYTVKYKGKEKRYLFIKKQEYAYIPFWYPD